MSKVPQIEKNKPANRWECRIDDHCMVISESRVELEKFLEEMGIEYGLASDCCDSD